MSRERVGQTIGALQAIQMACLAPVPPVGGLAIDRWGLRSGFLLARPDPVPETADSLPRTDRTVRLVA